MASSVERPAATWLAYLLPRERLRRRTAETRKDRVKPGEHVRVERDINCRQRVLQLPGRPDAYNRRRDGRARKHAEELYRRTISRYQRP